MRNSCGGIMMNIKRLPVFIEISFWQIAVAILTNSRFIQNLFKLSYPHLVRMGAFKCILNYPSLED